MIVLKILRKIQKHFDDIRVRCADKIKKGARFLVAAAPPLEPINIKPMSDIVLGLIEWLLMLAAGFAVLFFIIAGIKYIRSWGDPDSMERAKRSLAYITTGLFIILVSYSIVATLDAIIN